MPAGGSENVRDSETWRERVRSHVGSAAQVIVICGEHTEASPRIHTEFQIAVEEDKPYFLLWGRRELMCTKPMGAKPADGMYSWTGQFLDDQIRRCGEEVGQFGLDRGLHLRRF